MMHVGEAALLRPDDRRNKAAFSCDGSSAASPAIEHLAKESHTMTQVHSIDAAELQHELQQGNLPVLAAFLSPACSACRRFAPFLEEIAESHAGQVKVVQIDVSENPALLKIQAIQQVPALVIFWQGHELDRLEGLISPYSLSVKLTQLADLMTQFQLPPSAPPERGRLGHDRPAESDRRVRREREATNRW